MEPLLIVGAGPAGLSLAWWLKRLNVPYRVLDSGRPGESWRQMPVDSRVLSPWWTNRLPGTALDWREAWQKPTAAQYARYLADYSTEHALHVETSVRIARTRAGADQEFVLEHAGGTYRSRLLVAATGQYQCPHYPRLPEGDDGSILGLHAARFSGASSLPMLPAGAPVLVVGRRVTAGQVMVALAEAGHAVSIAADGPIRTRATWRRHPLKEGAYFLYEPLLCRLFPGRRSEEHPIMDGGPTRKLLDSGAVVVHPSLHGIRGGEALFADGSRQAFAAIVYATGYRPDLGWLSPLLTDRPEVQTELASFESLRHPGLFFLGLDNLYDFRSGFLRGISADSRRLAEIIQARLQPA